MRFFLLAIFIITTSATHAATDFEKVIGGADFDRGVFVSPLKDGGYITVGVTKSSGAGDEDVYLVKTDAAGNELWSKTFGGTGADNGWSVHEHPDGYVIAGFTNSFGNGDYDFYLIKTDENGEMIWSKTYGGERSDRCWSLTLTEDGGFLLAGETRSFGAGEEDVYLVRTDAAGEALWTRTYGGDKGDRAFAAATAEDGGYVLAGQTFSEGAGDRDAYILKTDADGEMIWSKTFGGTASDVAHGIVGTSDGAYMATGYTTSFAPEGDDPYIIKIDEQGRTLWTRVIALEGVNHTITGEQATDGGFFLTGFSNYPAKERSAAVLVKTDAEGRLMWFEDFFSTNAGSMGYTVRATQDGGCVFTGHTPLNSAGDLDMILIKVDAARP